jgi:UPF0755 protein
MLLYRAFIRIGFTLVILSLIGAGAGIVVLLQSKQYVFESITFNSITAEAEPTPFPVSVDPISRTITEDQLVDVYFFESLAGEITPRHGWWQKLVASLVGEDWYQNLASPVSRIVVIWPGERKEEIANNIGDILRWSAEDRERFLTLIDETEPVIAEGKFYPGQYVAHRDASPEDIALAVTTRFEDDIINRYTTEVADKVPLEDALIIASLLDREASDFENMREVSGVIWNRLFVEMPLQLDATLQYIRGNREDSKNWWPVPVPADKFLKSPYNTYANSGLPPGPIANPSSESILAALNPIKTDCLFYFHHTDGSYHCSVTYAEHVQKLRSFYGQGR